MVPCRYIMMWIRNNQTDDCCYKIKKWLSQSKERDSLFCMFVVMTDLLCLGNISLILLFSTSSLEVDIETHRKHVVVTGVIRGVVDALVCTELNIL